jgi:hypothetical protein
MVARAMSETETETAKAPPPEAAAATDPAPPTTTTKRSSSSMFPAAERASAADTGPLGAYEAVARSARLPDLVAVTQKVVGEAASARRAAWNTLGTVTTAAEELKLGRADAETPYGNALKVLEAGPEGAAERALACALWAHAVAEQRRDDEDKLAGDVLWLATHTPFDATLLLDRALGEDAAELWTAIADRVKRVDEGRGASIGRAEALVGAAALAASGSPGAERARSMLAGKVNDAALVRVLGAQSTSAAAAPAGEMHFEGEAVPAPRGPVATTLLAMSGILFVMHAARLVGRFALAYKRPAEVAMSSSGIRVKTRTEMLGRVLREREHVIPKSGLARATREVRYPRIAFYTGLLALALGSWVGVRAFVDGVRAASPSLLVVGLLIIATGIAADFVLGTLLPGARGRSRVIFVPKSGKPIAIGDVDAKRADEALTRSLK